jgi:hypothetical protein
MGEKPSQEIAIAIRFPLAAPLGRGPRCGVTGASCGLLKAVTGLDEQTALIAQVLGRVDRQSAVRGAPSRQVGEASALRGVLATVPIEDDIGPVGAVELGCRGLRPVKQDDRAYDRANDEKHQDEDGQPPGWEAGPPFVIDRTVGTHETLLRCESARFVDAFQSVGRIIARAIRST